ncbi:7650_t:CDS:1, partial [Funneliformis geosporum]
QKSKQNQEVSQTLYEMENNIYNENDYINDSNNIDDYMNSLNQMSEKFIDDIQLFTDINSEETILTLIDVFDSKIVKKSLKSYVCKLFV